MIEDYTKDQLWKLHEKLPKKLQEVIWSEETAENIASICEKNGIPEEKISEIAEYTGYVLLGILPLEEFQKTLEKKIKLEEGIAEKVGFEINRFIFSPVKDSLATLAKEKIISKEAKPAKEEKAEEVVPSETAESPASPEKEPTPQPKEDIYREPIE